MKRILLWTIIVSLGAVGIAWAGDLAFPSSEDEIADALSFKEQKIIHNGQEYVSTKDGNVFMLIDGKRFRMKGIGGMVNTALVPKAGALIRFDVNSANIKEESYELLNQYGSVLQKTHPDAKLIVEGHTDSMGSDDYNETLSRERAKAVKDYLITRFGISAERLQVKGAGEGRPLSSNDTDKGRSQNRRVEFIRLIQ